MVFVMGISLKRHQIDHIMVQTNHYGKSDSDLFNRTPAIVICDFITTAQPST